MSFKVNWKSLETDSLTSWTKDLLTSALNSGKSPNILASSISIKDLNFGKIAPNFEILEIGELGRDRFRGIFKINYEGDFHLTLHTNVQANPLNIYYSNSMEKEIDSQFVTPNFLLSNEQFALPLDLKLSDIKISGIGIIVFSKSKGLTLVFRNDPLDSIKVSSTFDTVQVLANFLQKQIETQIRDLFRETLPTLIHQFSLKYLSLDNNSDDLHAHFASSSRTHSSALDPDNEFNNFTYSSKNLQKNLQLFNTRETLDLHIPKFKGIIQRSHLEKFTQNYPSLLNSLYLNLHEIDMKSYNTYNNNTGSNGIPIDLLINDKNFNRTNRVLKEISDIQSNSFYKQSNNNKDTTVKPKRRRIKYSTRKKAASPVSAIDTAALTGCNLSSMDVSHATSIELAHDMSIQSETSTLINDDFHMASLHSSVASSMPMSMSSSLSDSEERPQLLAQPRPMRISPDFYQAFLKSTPGHYQPLFENNAGINVNGNIGNNGNNPTISNIGNVNANVNNTNSSLLSSVGLGTNYFNFATSQPISTSPIKKDPARDFIKEKKSINYIDINKVNNKLKELSMDRSGKRKQRNYGSATYESENPIVAPPPPYSH
ncbi:hypothetical protein G9P44_005089 [Scheffersomyces stipitis]|nr:hypothetical protein G9P44_005089 [Scheffersomyces stipitis]